MGRSFYENGLQFQCQGSGNCCVSRGEYGYVFLTDDDRKSMAKALKISTRLFSQKYCEQTKGVWHLKEDPARMECVFLKKNRCEVYEGRPMQCRTWPFWPEVMNAKTWKKEVASYCPGVGQGPVHSKEIIEKTMKLQSDSEEKIIQASKINR